MKPNRPAQTPTQPPTRRYGRGRAFSLRSGNYFSNLVNQPVSRREALAWIGALSAASALGMSGVLGLLEILASRRRAEDERLAMIAKTQIPTVNPTIALPPPVIIPRERWNARPTNHNAVDEYGFASPANPGGWYTYTGNLADVYNTVAIHHSYPIRGDSGTMRQIQDSHLDVRKWADIGYHYGVGRDGRIYAGRDIRVRGANVAGYNTGTIGVVAIGDFDSEIPTPEQLNAMVMLIRWLRASYSLTHLAGHYEFNTDTVCPGANMKPYLERLAQVCELQRGTGGYVPPTKQASLPQDGTQGVATGVATGVAGAKHCC